MNLRGMTSNQQRLALVALVAVGLLAGDRLVWTPLTKGWKARAERIAQLKRSVSEGTVLIEREAAIRARWEHMRTNCLDPQMAVAESQVLKAFDRWSRDTGVSISSLRPGSMRGTGNALAVQCRADASGDLPALTRFLYAAETDPIGVRVEFLELTARDPDGQQLTLQLQVSGLVLNPPGS